MKKVCFKCKKEFGKEIFCQHCNCEFYLMKDVKKPSNSIIDPDIQSEDVLCGSVPFSELAHPIRTFINKIKFLLNK